MIKSQINLSTFKKKKLIAIEVLKPSSGDPAIQKDQLGLRGRLYLIAHD